MSKACRANASINCSSSSSSSSLSLSLLCCSPHTLTNSTTLPDAHELLVVGLVQEEGRELLLLLRGGEHELRELRRRCRRGHRKSSARVPPSSLLLSSSRAGLANAIDGAAPARRKQALPRESEGLESARGRANVGAPSETIGEKKSDARRQPSADFENQLVFFSFFHCCSRRQYQPQRRWRKLRTQRRLSSFFRSSNSIQNHFTKKERARKRQQLNSTQGQSPSGGHGGL